jgi:hypothetical protein
MKMPILVIVLLTILIFESKAQILKFIAYDEYEVAHELSFGFDERASKGIDPEFEEQDISGISPNQHEIRILQNDFTNFDCLFKDVYQNDSVVFDNYFHSANNIRNLDSDDRYLYFEFKIFGRNWQTFSIIEENLSNLSLILESIQTSHESCDQHIQFTQIHPNPDINLYVIHQLPYIIGTDFAVTNITIKFSENLQTSSTSITQKQENIEVYPNPTKNVLYIKTSLEYDHLNVINHFGQLVIQTTGPERQLNISSLVPGLYFVQLTKSGILTGYKKIIISQ